MRFPPNLHLFFSLLLLGCACSCTPAKEKYSQKITNWRTRFAEELPTLGHRNWIVIADSAYPKQSAPGIETVVTGESQLKVLAEVLEAIKQAPHVQGVIMVDQELDQVQEADAPGVDNYRESLSTLLSGTQPKVMPHDDIIAELDQGSKLFNVLLLKTNLTIPYTSVFIQLDCGYWDAEKESRLRGNE